MTLEDITNKIKYQMGKTTNLIAGGIAIAIPLIAINLAYLGLEAGFEATQKHVEKNYRNVKFIDKKELFGHSGATYLKGTFQLPTGERFYAYDNVAVLSGKFSSNYIIPELKKGSTYNIIIKEGYLCNTKITSTLLKTEH